MIQLKNIYKNFDNQVKAINDISLKIDKGDIYGIIGLSGAGKSTLVRCINFLEKPTKGEVFVDGENLAGLNKKELRDKRKKIGMIFQNFNLLQSKTIFDNVAFPLKINKLDKKEIESKVIELLELVDLADKKDAYPRELSGGQKQRAAIARALANSPEILLCDEATSALDPKTTMQILDLLKKIKEKLNITIVIITHEMEVIKKICNKVAILENGKIIKQGAVIDIFASQNNEKIAHFLDEQSPKDYTDNTKILKLIFLGDSAEKAILSKVIRHLDIDFNISYGKIEQIQDRDLGRLIVTTNCKQEKFKTAIKMFEQAGVKVEIINE